MRFSAATVLAVASIGCAHQVPYTSTVTGMASSSTHLPSSSTTTHKHTSTHEHPTSKVYTEHPHHSSSVPHVMSSSSYTASTKKPSKPCPSVSTKTHHHGHHTSPPCPTLTTKKHHHTATYPYPSGTNGNGNNGNGNGGNGNNGNGDKGNGNNGNGNNGNGNNGNNGNGNNGNGGNGGNGNNGNGNNGNGNGNTGTGTGNPTPTMPMVVAGGAAKVTGGAAILGSLAALFLAL